MKSECFKKEQLMAYATKLLEPAEEARIQAHLAGGCEKCRAMVKQYRAVDSVLEEWKPAEPSPWFDARLRAAIGAGASGASGGRPRGALGPEWARWTRWLTPTLAAALVLVVSMVAVHVGRTGHFGKGAENTIAQRGSTPAVNPPGQAGQVGQTGQPEAGITALGRSVVPTGREEPGAVDAAQTAEDDDMLANFDVLSELPAPAQSDKVEN